MKPTSHINRRKFIETLGMGAIMLPLTGCNTKTESSQTETKNTEMMLPQIALQLWTVREAMDKDIPGALAQVADIGFRHVETAFFPEGVSFEQGAKMLQSAGLSVCSVHCEIPIGDQKMVFLEMAEAYNCKRMVWHGWPEDPRYQTVEGTLELAAIYEEAAFFAKENGLEFGLHNHWWECESLGDSFPLKILLERLKDDVFFEIDTYWAKVAGKDPAELVASWGKRAPLLHIKDGPANNPDQAMLAVGKGSQDFPAIAKAGRGSIEWMIVELDKCETDMMTAVKESYDYLVGEGLAR